ncbi:hypothetical protein PV433_11480 [Paenibacillus sp. GYB004]|uniref:hypothetical protein n=1 Tax=Paenibacillus sp. GYB004 TaxID=2994393 RepID=UPI002F964D8F
MSEKLKKAAFTKQQFLASRQRPGVERDILAAVLEDDKSYTIAEADKLIEDFLNKEAR